jgi:peptidyl-prolyl isomerase D
MSEVFFDISIGGSPAGTIVFKLYDEIVPRTALNFKCLCTGERGLGKTTGKPMTFARSIFHRIIPGTMLVMRNST